MIRRGLVATVAVVADRSLVADAVAAALAGRDLDVVVLPWPGPRRDARAGWPHDTVRPSLGVVICDLVPPTASTARWLVSTYPTRWLLLTDTPKGVLWGAMLELGVVGVLPSSTGLADLLGTIRAVLDGSTGRCPADRDELVAAWRLVELERESASDRLSSLTPREARVLRELHRGRRVHEIAELHGVARSTVRSQVRAVLQKLGVSSQLAATAVLERWGEPSRR